MLANPMFLSRTFLSMSKIYTCDICRKEHRMTPSGYLENTISVFGLSVITICCGEDMAAKTFNMFDIVKKDPLNAKYASFINTIKDVLEGYEHELDENEIKHPY